MTEKENAVYEFEKMAKWCDKYTTEELQAINYARKILHSEFVIIPKGATNGDVIKMMFPKYYQGILSYLDNAKWWDKPYKRKEQQENKDKDKKPYRKGV